MKNYLSGRIIQVATAALLLLITCAADSAMAADNGRSWRVSDIKGQALHRAPGGDWKMLKRGDVVHPGGEVKTGEKGRLILVRPGDSLDVAPNSAFNVPNGKKLTENGPATHIDQSKGTILFKITTRPENPFTVKTPYLAAVIKGTTFTVSVERDDAALHVSKGAVQVSSILTGQTALVRPGQTAAVSTRNGGAMRLIGFKKQESRGGSQGGSTGGSAIEKSEGAAPGNSGKAAGRGQLRSVIPATVGERSIDIGKASKGLVSGPSASPRRAAKLGSGFGKGEKAGKSSGGRNALGLSGTVKLSTGIGRGNNGVANRLGGNGSAPAAVTNSVSSPGGGNGVAVGLGNGGANGLGNGLAKGNANGGGNGNANGNGNGNGNGKSK